MEYVLNVKEKTSTGKMENAMKNAVKVIESHLKFNVMMEIK